MKDYIDLVLADATVTPNGFKQRPDVFSAPFNSCLKKGDMIIVESDTGVFTYSVKLVISCTIDSDEYAFVRSIHGKDFLRITSKAERFNYSDEDYMKGIE